MALMRRLSLVAACFALSGTAYAEEVPLPEEKKIESLFEWTVGDPDWISPAIERDRIVTDRPHISEATSTVGLGRLQIETGYQYFSDRNGGTRTQRHSFPEPLLRWGIFAEWFELRLGYNYLSEIEDPATGPQFRQSGSEDMLLAAKLALVHQRGFLPDISIFPQFRLPTGSDEFSGESILPGVNIAYSWAVNELIEIECNTVFNKKRDDLGHFYIETLQTMNIEYDFGDRWMGFTEYLAFMPSSSLSAQFEHYFHYGMHYFVTPNFQIDVHSAVGLNRAAINLAFTGIGFSWKY